MQGSLIENEYLLFCYKRTTHKTKNNRKQYPKVKTKSVNLNTAQNQPRNRPLARPGRKGTSSPARRCTWSTWAHVRHLVNGGGLDSNSDSEYMGLI